MITSVTFRNKTNITFVSKKTTPKFLYRGMKNSLEAIAKKGKKVAEKAISTQASNIQVTSSNKSSDITSSLQLPEKNVPGVPLKQSTISNNYKPLQPMESLKDKASANEIPPNVSAEAQQFQKYVDNKLIEWSNRRNKIDTIRILIILNNKSPY